MASGHALIRSTRTALGFVSVVSLRTVCAATTWIGMTIAVRRSAVFLWGWNSEFSLLGFNYLVPLRFLQRDLFLFQKIFIKTIASGVDFLGMVNFSDYRVLRTKTKKRM